MKKKPDPDLSQSVWRNLSDDQMKKRQCGIIDRHRNSDKYTGDAYLLFATAKIMASLLLVQMNLSPWHISLGLSVTRLFTDEIHVEREVLSFPLSCIFACLDCLCDLEVGPQVFSQLYEMVILVFRNLSAMIMRGERNLASDYLKSNCIINFNPVLIKCIKMHVLSSRGSHESFHLRLCLSSIRAIYSFLAVHYHETEVPLANAPDAVPDQSQISAINENEDDMWGDLDDSDLATLDLGVVSEDQDEAQHQECVWDLLSDAMEQSKVSTSIEMERISSAVVKQYLIAMLSSRRNGFPFFKALLVRSLGRALR
jgi:hypothetical protein